MNEEYRRGKRRKSSRKDSRSVLVRSSQRVWQERGDLMAQECGRELGHIYYYCSDEKLPLLDLLAVSKESGKPGSGCHANLAVGDLLAQQARVFIYDWLKRGAPVH